MTVTGSRRATRFGRALCVILSGVILVGIVACGESSRLSLLVPTPEPTPVIVQLLITVPPGRTANPVPSPTPTSTPTPTPAPTPTPSGTPTPTPTPTVQTGDVQVYDAKGCAVCHGQDLSGGIGPALACRTPEDLPEDRIRLQLADGGNGMPPFPELTEEEIGQLIELIRKGSC